MTRRAPEARLVSVTYRTVRRRDAILIGGQLRRITGVNLVHGGARLALDTGERLTIARNREYTVARPVPPASKRRTGRTAKGCRRSARPPWRAGRTGRCCTPTAEAPWS
jgi:hypothetical protein